MSATTTTVESEPYLQGAFRPTFDEHTLDLEVRTGALPADLDGLYVRNGSNPRFDPPGRYHWFDGDGMVHGVHFANGTATYRNRWVRTAGLAADEAAGHARKTGILERPDLTAPDGPFKDTGNTDVIFHNGQLLALWWLSGSAHALSVPGLDTIGTTDFGGTLETTINAHPKVDPATGDLVFTSYGMLPPYLTHGVISPDGKVVSNQPVELAGPRLQHDLAITRRHSILFDMSLQWDPEALAAGKTRLKFFRDVPTRIGVVERFGSSADVQWFEVDPFFMYHVVNAWDDGDTTVLIGCRMAEPLAVDPDNQAPNDGIPVLAHLRLDPVLWEWRLDRRTGLATERAIDDTASEFPRIHDGWMGVRNRWSYSPTFAPRSELVFDGLVRHDLESGDTVVHRYDEHRLGGEAVFAPSSDPSRSGEGDGHLVTFVVDETTGDSEVHVFDAGDLAAGPVCTLAVPVRVPLGYHTEWVPGAAVAACESAAAGA